MKADRSIFKGIPFDLGPVYAATEEGQARMAESKPQRMESKWADTVTGYGPFVVEQHEHHWCVFDQRMRYWSLKPVECFMSRSAALLAAEAMYRSSNEFSRTATEEGQP